MEPHRERLVPPLSWWVGVAVFALACGWLMYVAATPALALVALLVAAALAGWGVWSYGAVVVQAGPDGLRAGRAHLDPAHLGTAEALGPAALRQRLGADADARAWLLVRPYVDRGVMVQVDDPSDPTPYWVVSTRHPEAVVRALGSPAHQPDGPGGAR